MIDYVDTASKAWGAQVRFMLFGNDGWPSRSMLGKLVEEGVTGAGQSKFMQYTPEVFHGEGLMIARGMRHMAETHQFERPWLVQVGHYVFAGRAKTKAPMLGIDLPTYWRCLHTAHAYLAAHLSDVPRETKVLQQLCG